MQHAHLGRTGPKVSCLRPGTMNGVSHTGGEEAHAMMNKALEPGINSFDTSGTYGRQLAEGVTERIIGHWPAAEAYAC